MTEKPKIPWKMAINLGSQKILNFDQKPKYRQFVISVQIQYKIRVLCPKIMIPKPQIWLKWTQIS